MAYARPSEFAENLISDMYIAALGVPNFRRHYMTSPVGDRCSIASQARGLWPTRRDGSRGLRSAIR